MFGKRKNGAAQKAHGGAEGMASEPSEVRFRNWVMGLALLLLPPALFYLHYRLMFPGLTNPDALDYAQVGRNLHEGRGFVTYVLRPLALTHGSDAHRQPDLTHGPLYPFILALAFGALGAKDNVVAVVSGLFYVLTVPVVYLLGTRMFSRWVGVAAALAVGFNALLLEYATSGLPITLYIFFSTALLLTLYNLAAWKRKQERRAPGQGMVAPRFLLILTGVLSGALYLTDPIFVWLMPVTLAAALYLAPANRLQTAAHVLVPLGVLVVPWMIRNGMLTGNPALGLRGMEVWMQTRTFPGNLAYRVEPGGVVPSALLFQEVLRKAAVGFGTVLETLPQITANWLLAFFLPSLLFRFSDTAATTVRNLVVVSFGALFLAMLVFGVEMPLFVSLIPAMLVFSVAFLMHLARQARVSRAGGFAVAAIALVCAMFPLVKDLTLDPRVEALPEIAPARAFARVAARDEVSMSDQPWTLAWHADRPSIWVPASDNQLSAVREQFKEARWLFLTPTARTLSPEWGEVYNALQSWNALYVSSRRNGRVEPPGLRLSPRTKGHPLLDALDGYITVGMGDSAVPTAVFAAVPPPGKSAVTPSGPPLARGPRLKPARVVK